MEQLLLVNPRKRGTRRRKARTAAQKAATAKMLAANRRRRTGRSRTVSYAANPAPRRRRRAHSLVSHHVRRSRRRRNPIGVSGSGKITGLLMPALKGAVGAVAVDVIYNHLPLPATLKSGYAGTAAKAGVAILLGTVGRKFLGQTATQMAIGSLTVTAANMLSGLVAKTGMLGYYGAGVTAMAPSVSAAPAPAATPALGEYVGGRGAGSFSFSHGIGEYVN